MAATRENTQWLVQFSNQDGDYVLTQQMDSDDAARYRFHDLPELFELTAKEEDQDYCWAVFKKKTLKGNQRKYGIEAKGFWEVIEKDDDLKRRNSRPQRATTVDSKPSFFSTLRKFEFKNALKRNK